MTDLRVDWQALNAASSQIGQAAETFGRGRGQVEWIPGTTGAAAELFDRALGALSGALGKATTELQQVASHLSATAARYESTERMLASWQVPGSGGGS
jgi:ABC-type transporter Mla subunit MlaD